MDVLGVVLPVIAVAVVGYAVTAAGVFRPGDIAGLARYVFSVALPVMLFDSMSTVALPTTFRWSFLLAYYVPAIGLYGLAAAIGRRSFGYTRPERAVFGMSAGYSNTVLIGLPVITAAWGDRALVPLMSIISIHSAVMFSLTTVVAESGGGQSGGSGTGRRVSPGTVGLRTLRGMITNPIVVGLVLGFAANVTALPIPGPVRDTMGLIRSSAIPAALFVTGASLREFRVAGQWRAAGTAIVIKMFVHPAAVWALAVPVFHLPAPWAGVAVVTAALPTGINASVFARRYDAAVAPVATATLISTVISAVTVSVLLTAMG